MRSHTEQRRMGDKGSAAASRFRRQLGWIGFSVVLTTIPNLWVSAQVPPDRQAASPPDAKSDVPRLSMADFKTMFAAGNLLVIDVRDPGSFKAGHIPGAVNVVFDDFEKRADQIKAKAGSRAVVLYCSCPSEHASAVAARMLLDRGLTNVSALVGGYPEWVKSGGRIER